MCVSANLNVGTFDSHKDNDPDQMKLIPQLLAGVDYLLKKAEDLQIREQIVVVLQSEMGRTPNYNNNNGKDHWSIGSAMFLGAGITGNRTIGATDEQQFLIPVNPVTLKHDSDAGIRTRPEHIHTALREFAGINNHAFSKQFPLKVPKEERLQALFSSDTNGV